MARPLVVLVSSVVGGGGATWCCRALAGVYERAHLTWSAADLSADGRLAALTAGRAAHLPMMDATGGVSFDHFNTLVDLMARGDAPVMLVDVPTGGLKPLLRQLEESRITDLIDLTVAPVVVARAGAAQALGWLDLPDRAGLVVMLNEAHGVIDDYRSNASLRAWIKSLGGVEVVIPRLAGVETVDRTDRWTGSINNLCWARDSGAGFIDRSRLSQWLHRLELEVRAHGGGHFGEINFQKMEA